MQTNLSAQTAQRRELARFIARFALTPAGSIVVLNGLLTRPEEPEQTTMMRDLDIDSKFADPSIDPPPVPHGNEANPAGLHPIMMPGGSSPSGESSIAEIEMIGSTAVATLLASELALQSGVEQLSELLLRLEETGALNFVLDTQNVQYMDSACLGCLVEAMNRLAQSGGRIVLANANRNVQYLFRMTQLDRVFTICNDVISAIDALQPKPDDE